MPTPMPTPSPIFSPSGIPPPPFFVGLADAELLVEVVLGDGDEVLDEDVLVICSRDML